MTKAKKSDASGDAAGTAPKQERPPFEALRAQSTAAKPAMSFDSVMRKLEAFADATLRLPGAEAERRMDAGVQDAALAYFTYRLTPLAPEHVRAGGDYKKSLECAMRVAASFDSGHRKALLDQVLFNLNDPSALQSIAPAILRGVPVRELEKALLSHLGSSNELHLHNALQMPYFLHGRRPDYTFGPEVRTAFEARVAELTQKSDLNAIVRAGLRTAMFPGSARDR